MNAVPLLSRILGDSGISIQSNVETTSLILKQDPARIVNKLISQLRMLDALEFNEFVVQLDFILQSKHDLLAVS